MRGTPTPLRWCPTSERYMKRQQFTHRPAMVGDPRGHSRRRLPCMVQTLMRRAKVIDRTGHEHPLVGCDRAIPNPNLLIKSFSYKIKHLLKNVVWLYSTGPHSNTLDTDL